jgi:hypothetical protein
MSTHSIERSAWSSTKWLWIFLALSLIAWRVSSRTQQYHPSIASPVQQAQVSYFEANERNAASMAASRAGASWMAEPADRLFQATVLEPPPHPDGERRREVRRVLRPIFADPVTLFSNPPPVSRT